MSVLEAVAIGTVFASFQTVAGTLIAVILGGVLLPTGENDIYNAAALTAAAAILTGMLYQVFDPTFLTITTYLGASPTSRVDLFYSHMVFPIIRFTVAQLLVDVLLTKFIYQFTYQETAENMFTGLYSVTKTAFGIAIWTLFIVPAFAQTL